MTYPKEENKSITIPSFPSFPSPIDETTGEALLELNDKNVIMPLWYWQAITTYVIDNEAAIERLKIDLEVENE